MKKSIIVVLVLGVCTMSACSNDADGSINDGPVIGGPGQAPTIDPRQVPTIDPGDLPTYDPGRLPTIDPLSTTGIPDLDVPDPGELDDMGIDPTDLPTGEGISPGSSQIPSVDPNSSVVKTTCGDFVAKSPDEQVALLKSDATIAQAVKMGSQQYGMSEDQTWALLPTGISAACQSADPSTTIWDAVGGPSGLMG